MMPAPSQPGGEAANPFWGLVDGVVVINLDQRPDRWQLFCQSAQGVVPPPVIHRLSARLGRDVPGFGRRPWFRGRKRDRVWAARAGCVLSHRLALQKARDAGWDTVLVLEDDVAFAPDFLALATPLASALQIQNWQVCYLGFTEPWGPSRVLTPLGGPHALHQVHGCTTTHAYLVRAAARDWILDKLPSEPGIWRWLAAHRAIDRWYQRQLGLHFRVTCVSPGVIRQADGYSDIAEQMHVGREADGLTRDVADRSWGSACYPLGHMLRCVSTHAGTAADVLRGQVRRLTGF
jgi:hypothetical protein